MNWWVIGFAALPALGVVGCLWYRAKLGGERTLMAATATSRAAEVASLAPGSIVEVKGHLRCQTPVTAEFSQREEVYHERDSQGRSERKTRTYNVQTNTKFAPCTVEDASGRVALNIEGATVEGEQVVNRREREAQGVTGTILSIASGGGGADLIHTESILKFDIPIYVLGEVQPDHSIGKPAKSSPNKVFVVSRKSEEERAKDLGGSMFWLLLGAIGLAALAAGMIFWGVVKS
jgi:hypothetical protein